MIYHPQGLGHTYSELVVHRLSVVCSSLAAYKREEISQLFLFRLDRSLKNRCVTSCHSDTREQYDYTKTYM